MGLWLAASSAGGSARGDPGAEQPDATRPPPYSLLNPAPRHALRPLSADRPDATESPITVDGGRVQVEMSLVEFSRQDDGPRVDTWAYAPINLKIGVLHDVDVQFLITPWVREQRTGEDDAGGFGDLGLRVKVNLWGNDGGPTAMGLMPFVILPTGDHPSAAEGIEGGLILPFAAELPAGLSLGLMAEFDFIRRDGDNRYDAEFIHTAALGRDILEGVGVFVEYAAAQPFTSANGYRASLNTGLTFDLSAGLRLDVGVNFGLTPAADDLVLFAGMTLRY